MATKNALVSTLVPSSSHRVALDHYVASGGSITVAARESGLTVPEVIRASRASWWREALKEAEFDPVTSQEMGNIITREVGLRALNTLEEQILLDVKELAVLAKLGRDLTDVGGPVGGAGRITVLAQIDLRGMSPDTLRALRGREAGEDLLDCDDYIDAEYEDV